MKTLIFIEKNPLSGKLRDVSIELSAKSFQLMEPFNGEVVGIFAGDKLPEDTKSKLEKNKNRKTFCIKLYK